MKQDRWDDAAEDAAQGSEARQTILRAAMELVALKGANGTTAREITLASGANGAAVNYYFQSKDNLVRLAIQTITADVNRERLVRLDALEAEHKGPLAPRQILEALIEPILDVSRSKDGGSLYVRNTFQMRVDSQSSYSAFGLNGHVARRFVDVTHRTFPQMTRRDAVWHYEFARGAAIHMLANLDTFSRRFELLELSPDDELPETPLYALSQEQVTRVIDTILVGFGTIT
jgi:AcrR family transcriptional regulator